MGFALSLLYVAAGSVTAAISTFKGRARNKTLPAFLLVLTYLDSTHIPPSLKDISVKEDTH